MSDTAGPMPTFVELVLAGRVAATSIDDFVENWHRSPEGGPAATIQLHEYLGLTWDEYRLWVEQPEALRFVLAARRAMQPVQVVLEQTRLAGLAARANDQSEAAKVLRWLIERGRVTGTYTDL